MGDERSSYVQLDALRAFLLAITGEAELERSIVRRASDLAAAECLLTLAVEGETKWRTVANTPRLDARLFAAFPTVPSAEPLRDPAIRSVLASRQAVLVPARDGEPWSGEGTPEASAAGAHSSAYLPLVSDGNVVGVILLARFDSEQAPLTAEDFVLAREVAEMATLALEHRTRLDRVASEVGGRTRMADHLRLLAQASRDFSAVTTDYHDLLRVVAQTAGQNLGDICSLRLLSADGDWLRSEDASVFHADPEVALAFRRAMLETPQRSDQGFAGTVLATNQPVLLATIDETHLYEQTAPAYRPLLPLLDIVSLLAVPVISRGRAIGVLTLGRRRGSRSYDADDLRLAQDLADRAGLAIENAVLLADLEQQVAENKKAEVKFRGLLESAPDAIVIIDYQGRIVLINAQTESLFGYSRSELLGQPVELLVPVSYRRQHPDLRTSYFQKPRLRHAMAAGVDLFGLKKDGTEFAAEISLSPIVTPEGQLVTAVIRDITERKRLEESRARALELETQNRRVQEANRLKSEFLANMSHELRTPLNAIIGFSSLLHAGRAGQLSETQTEYLGDILVSSRHLLQLINDVLDLAKVEAGRVELQPEPIDLKRVSGEVRDILRGLAAEKRLEISVQVDESLGEVIADSRLLKQILYNYLSNAIKFTPEQGAIRVAIVAEDADTFSIRVEDNGIGIKPEDIDHLFVEFQQLDSGSGKKYPGTGLGLALTKRIVEAMGGSVGVTSVLGKGSVFSARLPRALRAG